MSARPHRRTTWPGGCESDEGKAACKQPDRRSDTRQLPDLVEESLAPASILTPPW
jgi:hypothetical protein